MFIISFIAIDSLCDQRLVVEEINSQERLELARNDVLPAAELGDSRAVEVQLVDVEVHDVLQVFELLLFGRRRELRHLVTVDTTLFFHQVPSLPIEEFQVSWVQSFLLPALM